MKLDKDEYCYHAGTKTDGKNIYSDGGRVLNFVCLSQSFTESKKKIFKQIKKINWENGFFRKDIGYKVIGE